jgi:hypothetical protein
MKPTNRRNELMVRMTDAEVLWLQDAAKLAGVPPSTYARQRLAELARQDLHKDGGDDAAA